MEKTGAKNTRRFPWWDFLLRLKGQLKQDRIKNVSGGVAFFFFLALFPALVAIISLYGLVADANQMHEHLAKLATILPEKAHGLIADRLSSISAQSGRTLGWGAILSLMFSFWTANAGTKALMDGINISYDRQNQRNFFRKNAVAFLFTIGAMITGVLCAAVVVGFPMLSDQLNLEESLRLNLGWIRWLILAVFVFAALMVFYKYAAAKNKPSFRNVRWGALFAVVGWTAGSLLFSWYVKNFGNYEATYGSIAAVIILMLWFFMSSFVIITGAEINAELEALREKKDKAGEGPSQNIRRAA